jgi:hypothetical protein
MAMDSKIWFNRSQPQTLQISQWLLYFNAIFGILFSFGPVSLVIALASAAAAFGIANEQKWGYYLGIVVSALRALLFVSLFISSGFALNQVISVMFAVALVVALLHPQSRDHQRIWFK